MTTKIMDFYPYNVIDTCSIWNVLSSRIFYNAIEQAGCSFICTRFVLYECLHKPRKSATEEEEILKGRLIRARETNKFKEHHISISDLQDVELLQKSKNLSKGELSSIAFAKKIGQGFLTDDQGARKLAEKFMTQDKVQTTPQLFGWLYYEDRLFDSDKEQIIKEHKELNRPLEKYFNLVYERSLQLRLYRN